MLAETTVVALCSSSTEAMETATSVLGKLGYERFSLLAPMEGVVESLFGVNKMITPKYIRDTTTWGAKDYPDHVLWMEERLVDAYGNDFFLTRLKHALAKRPERGRKFVITDLKYAPEFKYVINVLGGVVLRVEVSRSRKESRRMMNTQWPMLQITKEVTSTDPVMLSIALRRLFCKYEDTSIEMVGGEANNSANLAHGSGSWLDMFKW